VRGHAGSGSRFQKSGDPLVRGRTLADAEADGVKFAASKGAADLHELRAMPWQKLTDPAGGSQRFSPVTDGYLMPESAFNAMLHGGVNTTSAANSEIERSKYR
jgi:hypothetical protein